MTEAHPTGPDDDAPDGLRAFLRVLADADDGDTVARAAAGGLLLAWRPDLVAIYLCDEAGQALEAVGVVGLSPAQREVYARVPLDVDLPITRGFLRGAGSFRPVAGMAEEFPLLSAWAADHPHRDTAEVVGLPLRSRGLTLGVVAVSFPDRVERSWTLRGTLDGLAAAVSVWAVGRLAERAGFGVQSRRDALTLTVRQSQVLDGIGAGRTNAEIARALAVSVGTVKADISALFRLFGAEDRDDLVVRARRAGM